MESALNPFSPGSGLRPPALVGRQAEIDAFDLLVARTRGQRPTRGLVLHGLRGVGKTVLLNSFRDQAERADWFIVEIEGRTEASGREAVRQRLARSLVLSARKLQRRKLVSGAVSSALGTVKSFGISLAGPTLQFDVPAATGRADSGRLDVDLEELVEDLAPALSKAASAFAIFVDEMQDLDPELLSALLAVQHRAGQRGWPFYVIGAGLPSLPAVLSASKSYAERLFSYRAIAALDDDASIAALVEPAEARGVHFDERALAMIVTAAGGYPYFLQTYGQAVWDIASDRLITEADAADAIVAGTAELDMGFFPARWERATRSERDYLRAMSESGDAPVRSAVVAERMGVPPSRLSPSRQSLIEKGIIYSPDRGLVAFTVPHMAQFVLRQRE
ncbi:AAA family ATPase [Yonghaparkia sp. Soil809]|uniref:AAA family ATPase n=1 Tax=Yonghaparkia sp. Soil809 TaxID=1736417 RepID=UPI0006FB0638|nr:AAA family ATPase [Yonghaparkia sp. Soil809]KRF33346.1 hypothetical protein ASG83_05245 [Yonghaparkia sp. Soil809]